MQDTPAATASYCRWVSVRIERETNAPRKWEQGSNRWLKGVEDVRARTQEKWSSTSSQYIRCTICQRCLDGDASMPQCSLNAIMWAYVHSMTVSTY